MPSSSRRPRPASWQLLADAQSSVLTRRQARELGLSEDQWQWRLSSGRWQSVLPGVAVTHSGDITSQQRSGAAVLHAGPGACLSGDAALVEHGMRLPDLHDVHVAVPESRKLARQRFACEEPDAPAPLVHPHRVRDLEQWRHPVRRPPVVRVAPAVLHAAAWAASDRAGEWRVAAAVQQRLVLPHDLRAALAGMPNLRRRGLLSVVLDDVAFGAHAASELDFLRFLRAHRLPQPDRLQLPVRAGRVRYLDAWWERQRVTAELDGAHHRSVAAWEDDVLRANDLVVAERHDRVVLLRFSAGNLRHDAPRVAAQLAAVLL